MSEINLTVEETGEITLEVGSGPSGDGLIPGGTTGQTLRKASNADQDTEWADANDHSHAAATIAVTPAGNIESSNLEAALTELQADIDTRTEHAAYLLHANAINPHNTTHASLADKGTNDHAAIDSHIADTLNPHNVTPSQVGNNVPQWNANQIMNIQIDDSAIANGRLLKYNETTNKLEYSVDVGDTAGGSPNDLLGKNAGGGSTEWKSLLGTLNQIAVTHGVGSITLSLPQSIAPTSSPTFAGVTAPLTGNVTGNLTGNSAGTHTGPVTGDVTGNLTGNVAGNLTGNVAGNLTGDSSGTHTGPVVGDVTGNVSGTASNITGVVAIANGGTGATTAAAAREALGVDYLHGIEDQGTVTWTDATRTLEATGLTYWYKGTKVVVASNSVQITNTVGLWFLYFNADDGVLVASQTPWTLTEHVPLRTVFWNGSLGAVGYEQHGHRRDLQWHSNAHNTIGARYGGGLAMTAPSVGAPGTIDIAGGSIWDEDIQNVFGQQTNCRLFRQTGATAWTFENSNSIYGATVRYAKSDAGYAATDVGIAQYINVWVYASNDTSRPIYAVMETATAPYATAALARAALPPSLGEGFGITNEIKLIYRVILQGNETFVEATDYRNSSVLPAGGTASSSAAGTSFVPAGDIAATNVQSAIEELDSEKIAKSLIDAKGDLIVGSADNTPARLPVSGVNGYVLTSDSGEATGVKWALAAGGALSVTGSRASPQAIVAGTGIAYVGAAGTPRQLWFIQGSGGAVTVSANPQIAAGTVVGHELILVGKSNTNTVTLADGNGLALNGDWTGAYDSVLTLVWDSSVWVEISRK